MSVWILFLTSQSHYINNINAVGLFCNLYTIYLYVRGTQCLRLKYVSAPGAQVF